MSIKRDRVSSRVDRTPENRIGFLRYRKAMGIIAAMAVFMGTGCSAEQQTHQEQGGVSRSYVVETDGVKLHVEAEGNLDAKEIVIAVHGGPGLSLASLGDLTPLAGEDRLLVRYDQRGAGDSTAASDGDFSFASQVEDIEAIRKSTGADKVDLVGRSWGGLLATAYAAAHPENVDDLVLISSIPLDTEEFLAGQKRFSNRVSLLQESDIIPEPLPEVKDNSCEDRLDAVLPAYMADPNGTLPDGVGSCTATTSQLTYQALMEPGTLQPYVEQASRYRGDVLILAGEKDPFGMEWPEKIDEILGKATIKTMMFENTGHFVTFERHEESLKSIDAFIS